MTRSRSDSPPFIGRAKVRPSFFLIAAFAVGLSGLIAAQQATQTKPMPVPAAPGGARDAAAQPPAPAGTGAISGTLVAADTGRAVRRARVTLSGGDVRTVKSVTTDDRGGFSFTALSTGDFTLTASKGGFVDVTYGQLRPGTGQAGTPIRLVANQKIDRLSLKIPRGAVITGTILDEAGDPAFGVQVRAMRYVWRTGERTLQQAATGTTDDRGIYRIPALSPGDYVVSALPPNDMAAQMKMQVEEMAMVTQAMAQAAQAAGDKLAMDDARARMAGLASAVNDAPQPSTGYAPVYYAGTTQASAAATVTIGVSEEKSGVDMQLQIVPLATVSGNVISGQAGGVNAQLQLIDRSAPAGIGVKTARAANDGTFTFTGVTPGQYTLVARGSVRDAAPYEVSPSGPDPSGKQAAIAAALAEAGRNSTPLPQLWAMTDVTVDGRNLSNVALALQHGMAIAGTVSFEGGNAPSPAQLSRMSVTLAPAGPASASGDFAQPPPVQLDAEGRFTIRGAAPGLYRVVPSAGVPPGYTIKSAVFGGRDVLDFPLEVKPGEDQAGGLLTFSTRTSDVGGMLQDGAGAPAPGYTVVVFAADARFWMPQSRRVQTTRPATDGHFSVRALPAGDYRIAAVTDVEAGQWFDPAFLRQLVGASVPFTLGEGERHTQDLRIK